MEINKKSDLLKIRKLSVTNQYMAEGTDVEKTESGGNQIYYILGAVILVVIVVAGYLLRSQSNSPLTAVAPVVPTPTPGPITALACTKQYYNPVVGLPKYYLSVEGVDVEGTTGVDCTFTVSVSGNVVTSATATANMTAAAERGGNSFRCTTKGMELAASVPTKVDVTLKDNLDKTSTCTASFTLPKP